MRPSDAIAFQSTAESNRMLALALLGLWFAFDASGNEKAASLVL